MSASNKKKLRKEQEAAKLTEKQLSAQKEAKKTSLYTIAFVAAMAVLLVVAICVGVSQTIANSGIREKNTTALTVGDHKINSVEMNYFYMDAVNQFYSNYGSYAAMFGLDVTAPLNEQVTDEETGKTWADDFLDSAKENARAVYAMADAANAAGFTLSEDELASIETTGSNLDAYATLYGYSDADAYVKAMYGNGATKKSYLEYCKLSSLANAYYNHYGESLTYEDADLRAKEADNFSAYSSFTFNTYYLAASRFLEGGTTDADGKTTYSDEEKAASVAAAEEAAKALTSEDITSVEDLNAAIAALPVNEGTDASSTAYTDTLYSSVSSIYVDWVSDSSRKEGDLTYIANTSTVEAEDGTETTTVNGYYVVYFVSSNDNSFPLVNVRHILVAFEGGTKDEATGTTTYSDEEKAAAKSAAEEILAQWKSGDATEDSFAALANEKSDDGDGTTGGLYEDVYPGQMVTNFNDWCFDSSRKSGDTDIVETEYGYHVMYFVGESDTTYRDYMLKNEMRSADLSNWYQEMTESITMTDGNFKYVRMDLTLSK